MKQPFAKLLKVQLVPTNSAENSAKLVQDKATIKKEFRHRQWVGEPGHRPLWAVVLSEAEGATFANWRRILVGGSHPSPDTRHIPDAICLVGQEDAR